MAVPADGSLLHWADVVVITGYFVLVLAVGVWVSSTVKTDLVAWMLVEFAAKEKIANQ